MRGEGPEGEEGLGEEEGLVEEEEEEVFFFFFFSLFSFSFLFLFFLFFPLFLSSTQNRNSFVSLFFQGGEVKPPRSDPLDELGPIDDFPVKCSVCKEEMLVKDVVLHECKEKGFFIFVGFYLLFVDSCSCSI